MLRVAVLGCGRIGQMHAGNIARHARTELAMIYDVHVPAAQSVADALGAYIAADPQEVFASDEVDAVLIATATPTHADYIEMAVASGKAVLCEKPIDLDLGRVDACAAKIAGTTVPIQLGFNRRFDPGHRAARQAMLDGEIGDLHQVIITSRDPAIPPRAYLEAAGGLFRDMTIHDFDLARFMLDEEPTEVFAVGGALIDPV
ncbi:MAG: Gfo/Idh/MocA family oxidoreductase, partial [Rhodobacterales bacterium]